MTELELVLKSIPAFEKLPFQAIDITALKGLTNKNFLLQYKGADNNEMRCVLRIPRDATDLIINRENEQYNTALAYELGFAPKTIWRNEQGVSVTEYIDQTGAFSSKNFEQLADLVASLHNSKVRFKGELFAEDIAQQFNQYLNLCSEQDKLALQPEHQSMLDLCEKVSANKRAPVPSHIDLVAENILIQMHKIFLIDWEYSAMASPFWDLASLCNHLNFDQYQSEKLLIICRLGDSETDYQCLKDYQILEQKLSEYWVRALA